MKLEVRFEIPGHIEQTVELVESRMILGTLLSNHIVLRVPDVEPIHALIEVSEENSDKWVIVDLGSDAGVLINGKKIEVEHEISAGDKIQIGAVTLAVCEVSALHEGTAETDGERSLWMRERALEKATSEAAQSQATSREQALAATVTSTQDDLSRKTVKSDDRPAAGERRTEKKDLLFSPRKAKPSGDYLECVAYWTDTVLDVDLFHADKKSVRSEVSIGDPTIADFIAGGTDVVKHHVLAKVGSSGYKVYLRKGMDARIRRGGKVESVKDSGRIKLGRRDIIHIKYGAVRYFLLFVRPPVLNLPRNTISDPFFFGLSMVAVLFFMIFAPFIMLSDPPDEKNQKDDEWQIVYVPQELKKPEPVVQPKPKIKVAENKKPPVKKVPPPPKPKPVKPVKPVKQKVVKKVKQPKPNPDPQKVKTNNKVGKVAQKTPQQQQSKAPGNKSPGMVKSWGKKPDFKLPGPKNKAKPGLAGGPKGGGNNKAGAQRKGNKNYSAMGVSDGKINKPSGRNLKKLGLGAGKVLSKIGPSAQYTNFKDSAGGAGRGAGSGRKTVGFGGVGKRGSVGLGGTSGAVNNFGSGYGGAGSGLGGSGGIGSGLSGRGSGSGSGGRGRAVVNVPSMPGAAGGGLTQQEILDVIKAHLSEIRHCYDRLLQRSPNSRGKIKAKWQIGTNGRVTTVSILDSSISDSTMRGCVTSRIRRWKFPNPRNGKPVDVTFPFSFVSSG